MIKYIYEKSTKENLPVMEFITTSLSGVILIKPDVHADNRGFFLESYTQSKFAAHGIDTVFVQDNHSLSAEKGVLRGLHFQTPPCAQSKLIRATKGAIYDVVVDLRKSSPAYGSWLGFELTAENFQMLFVPAGFAHGFCTLVENTEVQYKVDSLYAPANDSGIRWNDPDLKIDWPVRNPILSKKDAALRLFKEIDNPF
jgi:dTDP-4-dehydrorhamnose 3,5-epimerase